MYGTPEARGEIVEHGSTRQGRWLRGRRFRIALWIAVAEGLLVVLHVLSWWIAILLAAALIAIYFTIGREIRSDAVRNALWIGAASQAMVVLVPILWIILGTVALIAVGILAVLALIALFSERA